MNPELGEIWLADLGMAAKTRPVIIVSRDDPDPPRALAIYVSCYAPKLYNRKMVKSCGVGILPARFIQIKCTTAYH